MKAKTKTKTATKKAKVKKTPTKKAVAKKKPIVAKKVSKKPAPKGSGDRLVQLFQAKDKINCGKEGEPGGASHEEGAKLASIAKELGLKLPLNVDGSYSKAKNSLAAFNKVRGDLGLRDVKTLSLAACKATITRKIEVDAEKLPADEKQSVAVAAERKIYGELSPAAVKTSILGMISKGEITLPIEFDDELLASIAARVDYVVEELVAKHLASSK